MSSPLFYILIANIALLSANAWFFMDEYTDNPAPEKVTTASPSINDSQYPEKNNTSINSSEALSRANNNELSQVTDPTVNFTPLETLDIAPQLKAQQELAALKDELKAEKAKTLKKQRRQQAEIRYLVAKNKRLTDKVSTLDNQVNIQREYLADSQQREQKLNDELEKERLEQAYLPNSPIERIKHSIDQHPDLLKVNPPINDVPSNSQVITDDVQAETGEEASEEGDIVAVEPFTGAVQFGFNYDQDNQVTKNILGRLILDYNKVDEFNINSDLYFEFESEDSTMTTEKSRWQLQGNYNLDPMNLVFLRSDLQRSKFASYQQEDTFTVGYGRIFFNQNNHKFNTEIGPGYKIAVPNDGEEAVSVDEFIIRTRLNYEKIISENLQYSLEGVLELGHANSVFSSEFKVQNRIYRQLYLVFDLNYKYNQNVPVDTVHREISTGFNIRYVF